ETIAHINSVDVNAVGEVVVSATKISALSAQNTGKALAKGGSAFSGASTVMAISINMATNVVLTSATAEIRNAAVETDGAVSVLAESTGTILADIATQTQAFGGGGGSYAIGVSLAFNSVGFKPQNFLYNTVDTFIGTTLTGTDKAQAAARIVDSAVTAANDISVDAVSDASVHATITNSAVATSISLSESNSGVSIAPVIALNRVASDALAEITEGAVTSTGIRSTAGSVKVSATDSSEILAHIKSSSVAVSAGTKSTLSVSIAATFARNEILSNATAQIVGVNTLSAAQNVQVIAARTATIDALGLSSSVALAASFGSSSAPSISGGGAVAVNRINGGVAA
ncbi:MAG: hypothetical protein Q8L76_08950, partial [Cypionkella sp.]|nr:hypothetical protein [Cypionkella sp.]